MTTDGAGEQGRLRAELHRVTEAHERLERLHRLTVSLAEVTTRARLADLVIDTVMPALGGDGIALIELTASREAILLAAEGIGGDALAALAQQHVGQGAHWSTSADSVIGAPAQLHGYVATPLIIDGTEIGVVAIGYALLPPTTAVFRGLVEDVARQLALALERAASYERLDHERERAEHASRAKDEFLAMLGHELRNPLAPILTAIELMRLRGEKTLDRERTVIERQVRYMIRLVDDLLDISRVTRGKIELRRQAIEISQVVAQAVELVSPAMEDRAHLLSIEVPKAGVVVHADPQRLAQVLANLLTNAAKYTPHGGRISLTVHAGEGEVSIAVRDSGIGIDAQLLPHVFELFVQGRQGIDRANGGLGLGLAIAHTLVELHGGTIHAHSEGTGKGAEFTVKLPRYANTRPSKPHMSGPLTVAGPGLEVLVVDDNEDAAFLFSEALKRLGHRVIVAHDGPSALELVRNAPPQIAFLDIGLPVMDGYELGRRLKEGATGTRIPKLVAVTGYGHSSDRERSRDAGFDLHLVKPIDLATVLDAIGKLDIR
ncbi:MAG: response regulator [Kofleriaceae bacterium]|nr:response regulator [Kofleriaceae bacterium]